MEYISGMVAFENITSKFDSLRQINNKTMPQNANVIPHQTLENDTFEKKPESKKNLKTIIISSVIASVVAFGTLFALAKNGKLGNKAKDFADNIFNFRRTNPPNATGTPAPSTGTPDIPGNTKPLLQIESKINANSLAKRRTFIDKLKGMEGATTNKIEIDEKGKIHGLFLYEIDKVKDKIYDKLRRAKYPSEGDKTISEFTGLSTPKIKVEHNAQAGCWDYRIPKGLSGVGKTKERISLNVRPDKELIRKLDEYFSEHIEDVRGFYKTPGYFEGWAKRHDPITIYLEKSAKGTTVLEDIAKIAEPYARETGTKVLPGKPVGKCCAHIRQPNVSDYNLLKERFIKIFGQENMNERINPYGVRIGVNPNISAGEFWSYNELFNKLTGENIQVLLP